MNLKKAVEKLHDISELKEDWDSYGAAPIKQLSILLACSFLTALDTPPMPDPSIVPVPNGDIQIEWHQKGWDIEIVFGNPGRYHGESTHMKTIEGKVPFPYNPCGGSKDLYEAVAGLCSEEGKPPREDIGPGPKQRRK